MSETKKNDVLKNDGVDGAELDAAITEAADAEGGYLHKFKKPFLWQGKEYDTLLFDFESLSGRDMNNIERELAITEGITVISPTMSGPFLMNMAAKAAGIGYDMLLAMPIFEANRIRSKARSFLLSSEL